MFNPAEYWRTKQERSLRGSRSDLAGRLKAIGILAKFFSRELNSVMMEDKTKSSYHTRTSKDRRMRRQRHKDRMRNVA